MLSSSLGLVDFAIGLVNSILNLPEGQVKFFGENSNDRRMVINAAHHVGLLKRLLG